MENINEFRQKKSSKIKAFQEADKTKGGGKNSNKVKTEKTFKQVVSTMRLIKTKSGKFKQKKNKKKKQNKIFHPLG